MASTFTGTLLEALTSSADARLTDLAGRVSESSTADRTPGGTSYPYAVTHEGMTMHRRPGGRARLRFYDLTQVDVVQSRAAGPEDHGLGFAVMTVINNLPVWRDPDSGNAYRCVVDSTARSYEPRTQTVITHLTVRVTRSIKETS